MGSPDPLSGLTSYRHLARTDRYTHNAGIFVRGALHHFDLPQVAAQIAPRPLTLIAPVDAMKRPVDPAQARQIYAFTATAYSSDAFRIEQQI